MTLKELFNNIKQYNFNIKIEGTEYILYIEGLNKYGQTIYDYDQEDFDFDITKIKNVLIELCVHSDIFDGYDYVTTITNPNITLDTQIEEIYKDIRRLIWK